LSVRRHERYRRDGMDLYIDLPVSFPQAALGSEVEVPSMDGPVALTLHAGTQSGATYRLRGRGMPSVRGSSRGDQLVTVHVVVPSKLSKRERELLEAFAREGGDRVEERSFFERVKEAFKAE
jgi:molecular chaperone DnaJ